MQITRVSHIAIAATDLDASMRAMSRVFDLEPSHEVEHPEYGVRVAMYDAGNTELELMQGPGSAPLVGRWLARGDGLFHVCLEVDDLRSAMNELKERGVRLLSDEPLNGHGGTLITFIDPQETANVLFELSQRADTMAMR